MPFRRGRRTRVRKASDKRQRARYVGRLAYYSRSAPTARRPMPVNDDSLIRTKINVMTTTTQKGASPFSSAMHVKMPWTNFTGFATTVQSVITRLGYYRLNSIQDPDFASGGRYAGYWYQLSALYAKYRVNMCKVSLSFQNPSAGGLWVGYRVRSGQDTVVDVTTLTLAQIQDMRNCAMFELPTTGDRRVTYKFSVPMASLFGISKTKFQDEDGYQSLFTTNPLQACLLEVLQISTAQAVTSCSVNLSLDMSTYVFDTLTTAAT